MGSLVRTYSIIIRALSHRAKERQPRPMSKMMRTSTSSVRSDPIKKGFEVRVPERRRFQHVGSKLDTGATARSVRYLTNSQVLRRRDETFRRISRDDLAELFEEYEKVDDERLDTLGLGLDGGCGPVIASYAADDNEEYERPYLVLDVRDPAAFARCHVLQARSMPCLLYTSPSPRDGLLSRMPSSA